MTAFEDAAFSGHMGSSAGEMKQTSSFGQAGR
jgi:hypothetical protein